MNVRYILFTLLILFLMQACSLEHKYAMEFARNTNKKNILVFTPNNIIKTNLKTYLLDSVKNVNDDNSDSLLFIQSVYLQNINDSLFLANYSLGYLKTLSSLGFNVYTSDRITNFLSNDTNNYRVNIAQIELEETLYDYRDESKIYGETYYHDHTLNAVYLNSWFEVSKYDKNTESKRYMYFATDFATDIPEGKFDLDFSTGRVRYMYNIDSLTSDILYDFAYYTGSEFAMYTYDLLLNSELNYKVPEDERTKYWRYDPDQNIFYPAEDDRLVPMDK